MIHFIAALFFTLVLLAMLVATHLQVSAFWQEIVLALRGELKLSPAVRPVTPSVVPLPRAA